jgi:hypothetical protein
MPSTDAALRMNSAQSAGCVVFTLTVGLLIDLDSKGGSVGKLKSLESISH